MPTPPPPPAPASSPRRPPVVPGYVVEELLGRGGSGEVWRARPRSGGPPVAVKVLVRGDPARQAREATLLGQVDHPHLVRLHEVVRHSPRGGPEQVALVLDLLEGGSLAHLLARRGRLRPGEVVTALAPVAAALAHVHGRGIVHGDLSPGNVVFTAEGRPVLTDLGVARVLGDAARAEVTPAYVDPTVARGGAPGPASDVFGVAAAAFHALTGVAPWNASGPAETLRVAAAGELPDLDLLAPEAPATLRAVIRRGLSPDPHERGTAAAFALDLRHAHRPEPVRLPTGGASDALLGETGQGPRTELTHQVPGRRARLHAAPAPPRRWSRLRVARDAASPEPGAVAAILRAAGRRVGVLLTVLVMVGVAGWLGATWGSGQTPTSPSPAADSALLPPGTADPPVPDAATPTTGSPDMPAPDTRAPGTPAPGTPAAGTTVSDPGPGGSAPTDSSPTAGDSTAGDSTAGDSTAGDPTAGDPPPDDVTAWQQLIGALYARRATAFTTADADLLDGVYAAGSELAARDREQILALSAAAQRLQGYAPAVTQVQVVTVTDGRAEVELLDACADYGVVAADGSVVQVVPGRGDQQVRMQLSRTAGGWRLDSARLA